MAVLVSDLDLVFPNVCSYERVNVVVISASATTGTPTLNDAPTESDDPTVCENDSSSVTVFETLKDGSTWTSPLRLSTVFELAAIGCSLNDPLATSYETPSTSQSLGSFFPSHLHGLSLQL